MFPLAPSHKIVKLMGGGHAKHAPSAKPFRTTPLHETRRVSLPRRAQSGLRADAQGCWQVRLESSGRRTIGEKPLSHELGDAPTNDPK